MSDYRSIQYTSNFFITYPDNAKLMCIANYFINHLDPGDTLESKVGNVLRFALDEVIDMPRTGRYSIEELEKTEKTYIGTKVEIIFRDAFQAKRGNKLDLLIDKNEVDVKNTVKNNWTIPSEAVDEICILLQAIDCKSLYNFGLIICRNRVLNAGKNRDGKRTISQLGKNEIFWIIKNGRLPKNFFLHMNDETRELILSPKGGSVRLANLFRSFQDEIISRTLVECVARQKDYMKRIRGNGGARDILIKEGLSILWAGNKEDNKILAIKGFIDLNKENFICLKL